MLSWHRPHVPEFCRLALAVDRGYSAPGAWRRQAELAWLEDVVEGDPVEEERDQQLEWLLVQVDIEAGLEERLELQPEQFYFLVGAAAVGALD